MAITWRNIEGGNQMVSMMGMRDAQRSMTDGFQGLQDVLKQYQGQEKANWDAGKEQNTQAFLDRLSQAKTPEEMAALQASGELDRLKAGFGAQIDRSAVRNALDTRGDFLRQQATNKMTYDNQAQDNADAPIRDRFLTEARQIDVSDPSKVEAQLNMLEARLAESGMSARGQAATAQGLVDIRKSLFGDYKTTQDMANDKTRLGLEATRTNTQVAEAGQRMQFARDNQNYVLQERAANALASQALEGAPDLATARDTYKQLSKDLPVEIRDKGLDQLGQLYTKATGITPEQDEEIQRMLSSFDADIKDAQEYVNSKPTFAQAEQDKVTEGVAIMGAMERTPGDEKDTANSIRRKVTEFRQKRKLGDDVNLGAVLQESLRRLGTYDPWGPGEVSLDTGKLSDIMDQVYNDFITYQGYQEKLRTAEESKAAAQQELMGRYKIRNAFNFSPPK